MGVQKTAPIETLVHVRLLTLNSTTIKNGEAKFEHSEIC